MSVILGTPFYSTFLCNTKDNFRYQHQLYGKVLISVQKIFTSVGPEVVFIDIKWTCILKYRNIQTIFPEKNILNRTLLSVPEN